MLIEMNLDERIIAKIKELVQNGSYNDEKELIIRAIENLYERTMASEQRGIVSTETVVEFDGIPPEKNYPDQIFYDEKGRKNFVELKIKLDFGKLPKQARVGYKGVRDKGNYVSHNCDVPKPEKIYGNAHTELIWIFHNRFLPVKFVITTLAQMMIKQKRAWISFDELKDEIGLEVRVFSRILSQMDFRDLHINPTVTFPKTAEDFSIMPRLRKMTKNRRKEKCEELEIVSKNRFVDQFVGRELSYNGKRRVAGACFEFGLMSAGHNDEDDPLNVTLSELGRKFVMLNAHNPIFKQLCGTDVGTPIKNIFSELEANFIVENIIPKFKLENIIVKKFLGLSKRTSVKEITEIFLEIQKKYLQEKYPEEYNDQKFINELEKNGLAKATTVMTRLVELGKVKRSKKGLSVFYIANTS